MASLPSLIVISRTTRVLGWALVQTATCRGCVPQHALTYIQSTPLSQPTPIQAPPQASKYRVLYSFVSQNAGEMSITVGDIVTVIQRHASGNFFPVRVESSHQAYKLLGW